MRKRNRIVAPFSLSNLVKLRGQVCERVTECVTAAVGRKFADTGNSTDFTAWVW
jgi:hypothetical protein